MTASIHGIVLAGGKSSRMGRDKALLPINGTPLLALITNQLLAVCDGVTVVTASENRETYSPMLDKRVSFAEDLYTEGGPLSGIHAGLISMDQDYGFLLACDMPLFSAALFEQMKETIVSADCDAVLCPGQPFHAIYHKRTAALAEQCLKQQERKLALFLQKLRCCYLQYDEACFTNLNTPEEYASFLLSKSAFTGEP